MKDHVLEAKQQVVAEIKEKIENAQSLVLVEYRGLTVAQITDLRNKYREAGVEYKVYKNTMMEFAFKEAGIEGFDEYLNGPNAVAFSMEDMASAAKVSQEFAKTNDKLVIKAGVVDGNVVGVEGIKALAELPSREVLIAQALGGLNAPITGFVNVLQGTIRNVVYALDAVRQKQEEAA